MSTKMLVVVGRHLEQQKVGIELISGELYPNYPNSLGMFQTKVVSRRQDFFCGNQLEVHFVCFSARRLRPILSLRNIC